MVFFDTIQRSVPTPQSLPGYTSIGFRWTKPANGMKPARAGITVDVCGTNLCAGAAASASSVGPFKRPGHIRHAAARLFYDSNHAKRGEEKIPFPPNSSRVGCMCRNIKTLYNFDPPASEAEVRASAVQFVRKLSGFNSPSRINEAAFNRAVDRVSEAAAELIGSLVTLAPPKNRDAERAKSAARALRRFGEG